ncbi:MAG: sugar transferase [Candidatus Wallbacteria bacterium]|nr:sugar transferase [Candidatus Wallbacteria bacterium]
MIPLRIAAGLVLLLDAAIAAAACFAASGGAAPPYWLAVPGVACWLLALHFEGFYDASRRRSPWEAFFSTLTAAVIAGIGTSSALYLAGAGSDCLPEFWKFMGLSALALGFEKAGLRCIRTQVRARGRYVRQIAVVGNPGVVQSYSDLPAQHPGWGVRVIAMPTSPEAGTGSGERPESDLSSVDRFLAKLEGGLVVDEVIAAVGRNELEHFERAVQECSTRGITIRFALDDLGMPAGCTSFEFVDGMRLLTISRVPSEGLALRVKSVLDIVGALVGLVFCSLAYLVFAPLILLESAGPIIFRQERVGLNGRRFWIYKFRTMVADAEERKLELCDANLMKGPMFKVVDDPRVTRLGRFLRAYHIDELPQFWNVLLRDMSLVGPRPPTPDEVASYSPHHWRRLSMKPGITGLWQIHGNVRVNDFEQVVRLDTEYIDGWTLGLDLRILLATLWKLATGRRSW